MLITAAGTAKPARVLVLGAGVAGLQAIATAKRLGAVVEAYDVRPAVKEEVESLGAKFVQIEVQQEGEGGGSGEYAKEVSADEQRRQQELLADRVAAADIRDHDRRRARPPGAEARQRGDGARDAARLGDRRHGRRDRRQLRADRARRRSSSTTASRSTARSTCRARCPSTPACCTANNVANLLKHLAPEGNLNLDFEDEIIAGACDHARRPDRQRARARKRSGGAGMSAT